MHEDFDGELPPEIVRQYPAEEVEDLGIIDLSRGVPPAHIRPRHVRLRVLISHILKVITIIGLLATIWWIVPMVAYCLLAVIGAGVLLIILDDYVVQWRHDQEQHDAPEDDGIWWFH